MNSWMIYNGKSPYFHGFKSQLFFGIPTGETIFSNAVDQGDGCRMVASCSTEFVQGLSPWVDPLSNCCMEATQKKME